MRIAIVTDAWAPQVNGVVRTLEATRAELTAAGHAMLVVSPEGRRSWPCPTYPEIRLAPTRAATIGAAVGAFGTEALHIATEGPLGVAARAWCLRRGLPFTTAYHTQFPDYVAARTGISAELLWRYIRWFHAPAQAVLASTPSIADTLRARGLPRVRAWGRGVDLALFTSEGPVDAAIRALPGPVLLHVGRVAPEKNIAAFLALDVPGSKVMIGDGPARAALEAKYPAAHFLGPRFGAELAAAYRAADVLVFPSRTDTFGLVMIEALACGTPVAGYPVTGPRDVLTAEVGALDEDLAAAITAALTRSRAACARYGATFSWQASACQFLEALVPIDGLRGAA